MQHDMCEVAHITQERLVHVTAFMQDGGRYDNGDDGGVRLRNDEAEKGDRGLVARGIGPWGDTGGRGCVRE